MFRVFQLVFVILALASPSAARAESPQMAPLIRWLMAAPDTTRDGADYVRTWTVDGDSLAVRYTPADDQNEDRLVLEYRTKDMPT